MRIACISSSKVPSSTANSIQMMKVCQALAQLGHEVRLWVPAVEAEQEKTVKAAGLADQDASFTWEQLASFYGLQTRFNVEAVHSEAVFRRYDFVIRAIWHAREWKADLIYTWPLQAAVLALGLHFPVVLELHGPPEGKFGPGLFRLFRRMPGKKRLLPITQALVEILQRQGSKSYPDCEIVVSPNGVDLERYQSLPAPVEARARLGLREALTVGYTGHLYAGRGMSLLVELAKRFPSMQFLWVGGRQTDSDAWKERLRLENISNVVLTGFIENQHLPQYQAAAEILLMPYERVITGSSGGNSTDYCSPMKMFEYLACGRAMVSSDLPVLHEVLNDANCIFCVPEDAESWTSALEDLVLNSDKRARLGTRARQDAQAYTWVKRAQNALAGFL